MPTRPLRSLPASVLALLLSAVVARGATSPTPMRFTPGEVLAVVDPAALEGDGRVTAYRVVAPAALATLARFGLDRVERVGMSRAEGVPRVLRLRSSRADFDPVEATRALAASGAFRAVCPDYRLRLSVVPDDPMLLYQWYVDDGGSADIRLPAAWDVTHGDTAVVIAIVDTGVDTGHPDLAGQIWRNRDEIPANGIDDDGDGYVDDVRGWDFGMQDADPDPEYTADPSGIDVGFHGTFCAGLASASTDDGVGIAGAGWRCRLMPLKVSTPDSGIGIGAVAAAVQYAADHHASVLSMSFGAPDEPGVAPFFQALVDIALAADVVCVAAAGNDGVDTPIYPAACDGVLAVGATDFDAGRASFSNWGPWVDVAAPGASMWSTLCRNYTLTELDQLIYILLFNWDGVQPYMYGDGTSFACPLTAGVCGLVRSRYPTLTARQVEAQIAQTGDAVAFDHPIGPRVNAWRAVSTPWVSVEPGPLPATLRLVAASPNPARAGEPWAIALALPSAGPIVLELFDVRGRRVAERAPERVGAGSAVLRWGPPVPGVGIYFLRVRDAAGATAITRVAVLE